MYMFAVSYYSDSVGVRSIVINPSVCASVCPRTYLWNHWADPHEMLCAKCESPVVMARYSCGGVALRYALPVLWMTSRLAVVGGMSVHGLSIAKYSAPRGVARPERSLMSMNALLNYCTCFDHDRILCEPFVVLHRMLLRGLVLVVWNNWHTLPVA